jgi:hypothetical protein
VEPSGADDKWSEIAPETYASIMQRYAEGGAVPTPRAVIVSTVTCRMVRVTKLRVLVRMIGFISTSVTYTHLITFKYMQYSTIADLHFPVHRCTRTRILYLH